MSACIVGWAHTAFGKHEGMDLEALVSAVVPAALADAGVSASDVDEVFVGLFNNGLSPQDFPASLPMQSESALRFKPATRVENACATGSAAIHQGLRSIAAGARLVLVVGAEKMTGLPTARVGEALLRASYVKEEGATPGGFAGVFGRIAEAYFARFGDQREALARIAFKAHRAGARNPRAHLRRTLDLDFCRTASEANPVVAGPLKRTDCSPISDGAAALVLASADTARAMRKAVRFRAAEHVNDLLPVSRRDLTELAGAAEAWRRALATARIGLLDVDVVETHDCFTIAELMEYEAMGLAARGEGARAVLEGWTEPDGRLPVNPSGGLKAKGHPIGATGVSMHVLAAMQLTGTAAEIQVPEVELAGVFNMGGVAVANYCSVLERAR
jgi:acetyl-CoA C-acetyltransferase